MKPVALDTGQIDMAFLTISKLG